MNFNDPDRNASTLRLICVDDVSAVNEISILKFPTSIGRGEQADIRFDDCWASRLHCRFESDGSQISVIDLNSGNGTFLNSQPVDQAVLQNGDHLTVGLSTFEVVILSGQSETLDSSILETSLSSSEIDS